MSNKLQKVILGTTLITAALASNMAMARDNIQVVGSSTVYPFATVVAETFGKKTNFKTPIIESTGSGGGLKLFCAGVGEKHPDFTNSSRRIKLSEFAACQANGVQDIIEMKIGYDGIVIANSSTTDQLTLSRKALFLALAKQVPNPDGSESLVKNTYETWQEVDASLPNVKIEVLGPPPTSGTRDAFVELAMEGGCNAFPWIKAMKKQDKSAYKALCHTIREDGAFIESGENDNLIVQKLQNNPAALGIFGYSFLEQNSDVVQGSLVDGIEPTFDAIADAEYPVSRPLYVYAKKAHVGVIDGMAEFMKEMSKESTWGEDGYLSERGLIPMPEEEREEFADAIANLTPLQL